MSDPAQAPVAGTGLQRRFAAAVTALSGLLMVVATFLPWLRVLPGSPRTVEHEPHVPEAELVTMHGWPGTSGGVLLGGIDPGYWTVPLGAILLVVGLALLAGVRSTIIAAGSAIAAVIAFVVVAFAVSNPQAAFGIEDQWSVPYAFRTVVWGLWLVFTASLLALVSTLSSLALNRPVDRPTRQRATAASTADPV